MLLVFNKKAFALKETNPSKSCAKEPIDLRSRSCYVTAGEDSFVHVCYTVLYVLVSQLCYYQHARQNSGLVTLK